MSDILFFHGFAASPQSIKRASDLLQAHGHRVTTPHMSSFSLEAGEFAKPHLWLEEAEKVVAEYAADRKGNFCLAGHSLGGAICAHLLTGTLAQLLGKRVNKCAFLATPAGIDDTFLEFWREETTKRLDWPFSLQVHMLSFLKKTDSTFTKIRVPSLILHGEGDQHIPLAASFELCKKLNSYCAEQAHHLGADHFFPSSPGEGPDFLLEKLVDFFSCPVAEKK